MRTVVMLGAGGFGACWVDAVRASELDVVGIIDVDEAAASDFGANVGFQGVWCADVRDWLGRADILIDATPPAGRSERLEQVAGRVGHVIMAKPATWSSHSSQQLSRQLTNSGVRAWVAMQKRYLPAYAEVRRLLEADALGEIKLVQFNTHVDGRFWQPGFQWRRKMEFPSLWEGAVHQFDLLHLWLPGFRVERLTATAWRPKDSAFQGYPDFNALLETDRGVVSLMSRWSRIRGPASHYFTGVTIEGERGYLEVRDGEVLLDGELRALQAPALQPIEALNVTLLEDILCERRSAQSLSLDFHCEVLATVERTERAIQQNLSGFFGGHV